MSQTSVKQILKDIESLGEKDRARLESEMSRNLNRQWNVEATRARKTARRRQIDQSVIDKAIRRRRYGE